MSKSGILNGWKRNTIVIYRSSFPWIFGQANMTSRCWQLLVARATLRVAAPFSFRSALYWLGREFLVLDMLRANELFQCIPEQIWILPIVEPPFQFVEIGVQVLLGDMMKRTNDRPLQ